MKFFNLLSLSFVILLSISCAKDGEQGPAGPQGPAGANGNANVTSYYVNTTSANWTCSGLCYTDVNFPQITQSILNSGLVCVFMQSTSSTGVWLNMPWTEFNTGYSSNYNFNYSLGSMRIFKQDSDLVTPSNPGVRTFKVIIIPSSQREANPDVNWNNLAEIEKRFNVLEQ